MKGDREVFARSEFNGDVCARLLARPEIPFHRGFRDTGVKPGKLRVAVRRFGGERDEKIGEEERERKRKGWKKEDDSRTDAHDFVLKN